MVSLLFLMWLWAENMFLTASTLYNDDYGVAVLDFLVNKLEQERKNNENRDCWCNGTRSGNFIPINDR